MPQEDYNKNFVEINKLIQINNLLSRKNQTYVKKMLRDINDKYKKMIDSKEIEDHIIKVNDKLKNIINSDS